jgi:hypothetical protein
MIVITSGHIYPERAPRYGPHTRTAEYDSTNESNHDDGGMRHSKLKGTIIALGNTVKNVKAKADLAKWGLDLGSEVSFGETDFGRTRTWITTAKWEWVYEAERPTNNPGYDIDTLAFYPVTSWSSGAVEVGSGKKLDFAIKKSTISRHDEDPEPVGYIVRSLAVANIAKTEDEIRPLYEALLKFTKVCVDWETVLINALIARPAGICVPLPTAMNRMEIDGFHAIAATLIMNGNITTLSGTYRYFHKLGTGLVKYWVDLPSPVTAYLAMAKAVNTWIPHSDQLGVVINYYREIASGRSYPRQHMMEYAFRNAMDIGYDVPGYLPARTEPCDCSIYEFYFGNELSLYLPDGAPHDQFILVLRTHRELRAPWLCPTRMTRTQLTWYLAMLTDPVRLELVEGSTASTTIEISWTWVAGLIGTVEVTIPDIGRSVMTVDVSMNPTNPFGPPVVTKHVERDTDTDDLTAAQKEAGGKAFLDLLGTEGWSFRNVPEYLPELKDGKCVVNAQGRLCILVKRKKEVTMYPVGETISLIRNYHIAQSLNLPDYRGTTVAAPAMGVICRGSLERVAAAFERIPAPLMRRLLTLIRNYETEYDFTKIKVIYEADRDVFKIMCLIAAEVPAAMKRVGSKFFIKDGPLFWSLTREHIVMEAPQHHPWRVPIPARTVQCMAGFVQGRLSNDELVVIPTTEHEAIYGRELIKFTEACLLCETELPTECYSGCRHVNICEKCAENAPPECKSCGQVSPRVTVHAPLLFDIEQGNPAMNRLSPTPNLFKWQREAFEQLIAFERRSEMICLQPGSGKTLIILEYLRWCIANGCMTKYVLWTVPQAAFMNIISQCARAGFRCYELGSGEMPKEGVINLLPHTKIIKLNSEIIDTLGGDMTLIIDEFHTCMSGGTVRNDITIELAKAAYRVISVSGTVYKNKTSGTDLARFLALAVDFAVHAENYCVALGMMISRPVPSKSSLVRTIVHIPAGDEDKFIRYYRKILEITQEKVRENIGVIIGAADAGSADEIAAVLMGHGIRVRVKRTGDDTNYEPKDHPDPRGPGFIAKNANDYDAIGDELVLTAGAAYPMGSAATSQWTSHMLPQAVIVPMKEGNVAGYNLNRYRFMIIPAWSSNQATRGQFEGRIDRVDNDARIIEYVAIFCEEDRSIFEQHEMDRRRADRIRDIGGGDDTGVRRYDQEIRRQRRRAAEEREERARSDGEGYSPVVGAVRSACAILGINYTAAKASLKTTSKNAYYKLLIEWHPDKWADGTAEEQRYATEYTQKIVAAYSTIQAYTSTP